MIYIFSIRVNRIDIYILNGGWFVWVEFCWVDVGGVEGSVLVDMKLENLFLLLLFDVGLCSLDVGVVLVSIVDVLVCMVLVVEEFFDSVVKRLFFLIEVWFWLGGSLLVRESSFDMELEFLSLFGLGEVGIGDGYWKMFWWIEVGVEIVDCDIVWILILKGVVDGVFVDFYLKKLLLLLLVVVLILMVLVWIDGVIVELIKLKGLLLIVGFLVL